MPDPSTTRLALYKSKSDGSELVNYTQDIGQNLDKIDAAVGFASCTSSTRPSSPYSGKPIFETDTSYRTFFSNGTSPASASWVEIPNGSAQYNSTLRLASGKQINVNSSGSGATIAVVNAAAGTDLLSARVTGDTVDRFEVETDGTLNWGPGASGALDTNLYRSAANTLRTADNLTVDLNLTVSGTATITSNLSVSASANITGNIAAGNFSVVVDWTTPTLFTGYTADGNGNGTPQYRVINLLGTQFVQWRGGLNVPYTTGNPNNSGMPFTANLPANARPASRRSTTVACSAASSSSLSIKFDFNTDGSVTLINMSGVTPPWVSMNNIMYSL